MNYKDEDFHEDWIDFINQEIVPLVPGRRRVRSLLNAPFFDPSI